MTHQKKAKKIVQIFNNLSYYPHSITEKDFKKAVNDLIKQYTKGDNTTKGMMIFTINEKFSKSENLKKYYNQKRCEEELRRNGLDAKKYAMSEILDFFSSIEGQFFLLEILSKFDDELSIKLITHYITKFMTLPGRTYSMLAEKGIEVLGFSKNIYSVKFLLSISDFVPDERTSDVINAALEKWQSKLPKIKISKSERKKIKQKIEGRIYNQQIEGKYHG